jgi:hypothetical protein
LNPALVALSMRAFSCFKELATQILSIISGALSPFYFLVALLQWLHLNALRQMLSQYNNHLSEELVIMISKSREAGCKKYVNVEYY